MYLLGQDMILEVPWEVHYVVVCYRAGDNCTHQVPLGTSRFRGIKNVLSHERTKKQSLVFVSHLSGSPCRTFACRIWHLWSLRDRLPGFTGPNPPPISIRAPLQSRVRRESYHK